MGGLGLKRVMSLRGDEMKLIELCDDVLKHDYKEEHECHCHILAHACKLMYENIKVWEFYETRPHNMYFNLLEEIDKLVEPG